MTDLRQRLLQQPLEGTSTALPTSDAESAATALPTSATVQPSTTQLTTVLPSSEAGNSVSTSESVESNPVSTTQTSSVVSTSETAHYSTETPSPTLTEDVSRIPVEEGLMKKVILPELCSITGLGCRDTPNKPSDFESQKKLENISSGSNDKDDLGKTIEKEFPGNFFLENSQRISPIGYSVSSTTENVMFETAHTHSKDGFQSNEDLKKQNESDKSIESSSSSVGQTTNDASSSEPSTEVSSSSTEREGTVQEKRNEQALQTIVEEDTFLRQTNLDKSDSREENQQVILEDHPQLISQEENEDELMISKSSEETPQVTNKSIRRLDGIKIAEEQPGMEENEETTTKMVIKEISEQSKKKTKTSEEEQKLMEVSPFDGTKAVGEESLSIGDRISNYWHAATDYVSKVLNI